MRKGFVSLINEKVTHEIEISAIGGILFEHLH